MIPGGVTPPVRTRPLIQAPGGAPPGAPHTGTRATSPSGENRTDGFLSPRIVAREAVKMLTARGLDVRPPLVRRLVTRYIREGHTTTAEIEPFILRYVDPTGETAVRNVMQARHG